MPGAETIGEALTRIGEALSKAGIPEPMTEAEFILMRLLGLKRHSLFLDAGMELSIEKTKELENILIRRLKREPPQYIFGEADFRGLTLKVTRDVLIPRPETELLAGEAVKLGSQMDSALAVIDLCTGSGCIAVSIASEVPGPIVYATDISEKALQIASKNAARAGVADKVRFLPGDLFSPLPDGLRGRAGIIVSNPPYVPEGDLEGLDPEVRDFEPRGALSGGEDGLYFIRRIVSEAPLFLAPGGWLLIEMGYGQSEDVMRMTESDGRYDQIEIIRDYGDIERILKARHKP
ncbi:MAG: peptide chain release factor N(5)-glutamine methyltransferase [Deltaproteobacteria bacterium]|nr:peptide chain release factor N(5)-glutamine methyltransferase [Deltaproteobacteria bacterium]MBZ0220617.1 peptide chain release factor N(5)-glutamine methyltransferase [Deltaproteobacteria bacterium]